MVHLFLLQALMRRILAHSIGLLFGSSGDDSPFSDIPPEILDHIIDFLHNDRRTLLVLSLVSKQTLVRSRFYLFSNLKFVNEDRKINAFFALLDVPWTSFAHIVESLRIKEQFNRLGTKERGPFTAKHTSRIIDNLSNLRTLRLTYVPWPYYPFYIGDIFFQFNLTDFHLDSVALRTDDTTDFVNFSARLQPSLQSISLYNLEYDDAHIPDLSANSTVFRRPIHLKKLDTYSLLLLKSVWDPLHSSELDITVESFHLRFANMPGEIREAYTPFISRFLKHVGPSLYHLSIKLTEAYCRNGKHAIYHCLLLPLKHCR